jgi:hypothetical protein
MRNNTAQSTESQMCIVGLMLRAERSSMIIEEVIVDYQAEFGGQVKEAHAGSGPVLCTGNEGTAMP